MDTNSNFFNMFGLAANDTSTSAASAFQSATNRPILELYKLDAVFRSESSNARFQALLSWNRTASRGATRSTSSSSWPFRGMPAQTPSIFNPNHSLTTPLTTTSDVNRSAVIMSVVEGRGQAKATIGMAAIDLYNPLLLLSQFTDSANYDFLLTKMDVLQPIMLLIPKTFLAEEFNHLVEAIQDHIKLNSANCTIRDFDRKHFKDSDGIELVQKLRCDDNPTLMIELKSKYYCLAACAALLKYIEIFEHIIYAPRTLRIDFEAATESMSIDPTTAKLLELITNLNDPKSSHSLFGTINRTKTRAGYRLLRSSILQPSTDQKLIESRLDMVKEIISSESLFTNLETILTQLTSIEIERIISVIVQTYKQEEKNVKGAERKIETVIILKHIISLVEPLKEVLSQCESIDFKELIELLTDPRFELIMTCINNVIEEKCKYVKGGLNMTLEKCHAIKKGINSLLDLARDTYSESIDDISHMVDDYRLKTDLPMKVAHTTGRGYYIEMRFKEKEKASVRRLPKEFIKVITKKNIITCSTWDIVNKNNRINASIEEIYLTSEAIINALFEEIRQFIGCLYNLSESLSKIDLVFSFACQCAIGNYVRPEFGDYIAIKGGRHPVLEKVLNEAPVPNDTFITEDHNFHVITGPNMSGKSTLLKQVALLQVMVQIGSYIPADHAKFRICDKLFSRIGNNDEIETNSSTFMVEMRDMSYIYHNLTNKSLVIIDELGRGTSSEEAIGLCFAICEQLLKSKAFTLFVTHFLELTNLQNYFFNVTNYTFGIEKSETEENQEENAALKGFTHVLEPGVTKEPFYGIRLAKSMDMPPEIVQRAEVIADQLKQTQSQPIFDGKITETMRLYYNLYCLLKTFAKEKRFTDLELITDLQASYRELIAQAELEEQQTESSRITTSNFSMEI